MYAEEHPPDHRRPDPRRPARRAATPVCATPNHDRIADGGVRFTRAYAPNPICVPARATMTTGNHSHKGTGTKDNGGRIGDDQPKLAEHFGAAGYETYAMRQAPLRARPPRVVHGFQHWELTEWGRLMRESSQCGRRSGSEEITTT